MITREPTERLSAEECLNHRWFQNAELTANLLYQINSVQTQRQKPVQIRPRPQNKQTRMSSDGIKGVKPSTFDGHDPTLRRLNNVIDCKQWTKYPRTLFSSCKVTEVYLAMLAYLEV